MASHSQKLIIAALILTIAIPTSTAHGRDDTSVDTEQYIRDLCSETNRSDVCLSIYKNDPHRFEGSDQAEIAASVIDLAIEKSEQIGNQLNQWYLDSNDDRMKEKYHSCAENYFAANRYLKDAQRNLGSDDYRRIWEQIEDSEEEVERCKRVFEGSPDPGHVGDRINEMKIYLDMVRAATAN